MGTAAIRQAVGKAKRRSFTEEPPAAAASVRAAPVLNRSAPGGAMVRGLYHLWNRNPGPQPQTFSEWAFLITFGKSCIF